MDAASFAGFFSSAYHALADPLGYAFMVRALAASLLVGIISSVLSCYLVVKRWALLGDAISHAVLPGVAIAFLLNISFFIGALVTGVATALGIGAVTKYSKIKEDTAMGVLFTTAFALGVVLLSRIRSKSVDLYHILFGNVLGVSTSDLIITAVAGAIVLVVILALYKEFLLHSFDPVMAATVGLPTTFFHYLLMFLLSVTIVASLQTVGIILVIAMLIIPGATAYLLTKRLSRMMLYAVLVGVVSSVAGLYLSYYANVASGATMVLVAGTLFVVALLFAPGTGLAWRALRKRKLLARTRVEDYLTSLYRFGERGESPSYAQLAERVAEPQQATRAMVATLQREGLVERQELASGAGFALTELGRRRASHLITVHRLWEKYLVDKANVPLEHVHDLAHRYEHLTSEELAAEIMRQVGVAQDLHGTPPPQVRASGAPASSVHGRTGAKHK